MDWVIISDYKCCSGVIVVINSRGKRQDPRRHKERFIVNFYPNVARIP